MFTKEKIEAHHLAITGHMRCVIAGDSQILCQVLKSVTLFQQPLFYLYYNTVWWVF